MEKIRAVFTALRVISAIVLMIQEWMSICPDSARSGPLFSRERDSGRLYKN